MSRPTLAECCARAPRMTAMPSVTGGYDSDAQNAAGQPCACQAPTETSCTPIRIGDSAVMLVDEAPEWGMLGPKALKGSSVHIHLYTSMTSTRSPREPSLRGDGHHACGGHVLGRPLWPVRRSVRPSLVGHHARSGCDAGTNERSPADHEPRITGRRITRGPVSERLTLRIQALSWRHVSDLVQ